jgi:hypothetical protein
MTEFSGAKKKTDQKKGGLGLCGGDGGIGDDWGGRGKRGMDGFLLTYFQFAGFIFFFLYIIN